jgi:hypothetical protein
MGTTRKTVRKQQEISPNSRRIICSKEVRVVQRMPITTILTLAEIRTNRARDHTGFLKRCE